MLRRPILLLVVSVLALTAAPPPASANDPSPTPLPSEPPGASPVVEPIAEPSAEPMPTPAPTLAAPTPAPATVSRPTPAPATVSSPTPVVSDPTSEPEDGSITLADGTVLPPMPNEPTRSVHAEMLAEHADDPNSFVLGGKPTIVRAADGTITSTADATSPSLLSTEEGTGTTAGLPNGMRREVFGFLPYWMLNDTDLAEMNYQLVSTIAYFSVGALPDGNLDKGSLSTPSTGWAGWTSSHMTSVIDRAHAAGGKVVLTVTMMAWNEASYDKMRTLLNSSTNRSRLVTQIVDAVRSRGADGVNLDFELVPSDLRSQYTSFVRQVKAALVNAKVGSYLTVCTTGGAASWATGYDVPNLVASGAADAIFVMGYDFHWSGSTRAGGVGPVDSPYVLDVSTALADFLRQAPASKLIWGVPYYGRGWNTTTNTLNGATTGGSFSYYYTGHLREAATYGRLWDAVGKVPWYRYWSTARNSWVQVYYDDATSLGVKYDLVNRYNLAGTGVWHLLMDGSREELWRLIADKFVTDTTPPAGGVRILPQQTTSNAMVVSWHAIDYQSGLWRYNVQVRDRASSTWSGWLTGTEATSAVYIGTPGRTYEFRVQAVDHRGNAQEWIAAPGKPPSVRPGSFAMVTTSTLNVRSGAGTGYGILDTVRGGDRVYVMSGPVSAGGTSWFQVEYGFAEWPSAEYAKIGWVALGTDTDAYLAPAYAPGITHLSPFVGGYAPTVPAFSPNGDGARDIVSVRYSLAAPAASMRIDVVTASGMLVRSATLGSQAAGANQVSWDGRANDGAVVPDGRYLIRLVVTDTAGRVHVAPADSVAWNVLATWGVSVDRRAPTVTGTAPAAGSAMLAASQRFTVTFSEPMQAPTSSTVRLAHGGTSLMSSLAWNAAARTITVTPASPLPVDATVQLSLSGMADVAGNPLPSWSGTFGTAPGEVYRPFRALRVGVGTHTGYRIGADGDVTGLRTMAFPSPSGATVSQRATLPNLPGRWLYVENGVWAGMWVQESGGLGLGGETARATVPSTTRLAFAAGTHSGFRFDTAGTVTATKAATIHSASGANTTARAIINGRAHWYVINGIWAGWWIPESAALHVAGFVDRMALPSNPRITFHAGTYTGYRYNAEGRRLGALTRTLPRASGAPIEAWAVVNGRPHHLVSGGIWDGYWVPVDGRMTLAP